MRKKIMFSIITIIVLIAGLACIAPQAAQTEDKTWLSPGKIQVNNLRPGNSIKQKIKLHNGNEQATKFSIYYRMPDYVENNFIPAPDDARDWIIIAEDSPVLAPQETKEIQVVLDLPDKAQTPERWEFWIGVKESKEARLATELCVRWLIIMRSNGAD